MKQDKGLAKLAKREAEKALKRALENFDWEAHCRRVDEEIAPEIEAYRIARIKSYAQARYHVFL